MKTVILSVSPGIVALLAVLGFAALLIFVILILKRYTNLFHKDKKPSDEKIVKDELNRVLEEVKDEETKQAMEDFSKNHPQDENKTDENHQ